MKKLPNVNTFLYHVNLFYLAIGMLVYDKAPMSKKGPWKFLRLCLFFICQGSINFVLATEIIYVIMAIINGSNFLEALMNIAFISFTVLALLKICLIYRAYDKLSKVVRELQQIHPKDANQQESYKVDIFLQSYRRISKFYFTVHVILIWVYNLYWAMYYLIFDYLLGIRTFERTLPYYAWMPWSLKKDAVYYFFYILHNICAHTCCSGQTACDMFLCAVVMLLVMHFQYLARHIAQYVAGLNNAADIKFLINAIKYHQKILALSDTMNEIFGVSLLCNFLTSTFVLCILGFQLTIGGKLDDALKVALFLFCSVVQVFTFCDCAQKLLDASLSIGDAMHTHNWYDGDRKYRKMLVPIIQRSQKATTVQATSLLRIAFVTMTALLQLSYKFFALLRTMYVK